MTDPTLGHDPRENLLLEWSAVFESGLPQGSFQLRAHTDVFDGATRTDVDRYFVDSETGTPFSLTADQVESAAQLALLPGGAPDDSTWERDSLRYWNAMPQWRPITPSSSRLWVSDISFQVTAYDTARKMRPSPANCLCWSTLPECPPPLICRINTTGQSWPVAHLSICGFGPIQRLSGGYEDCRL